MLLISEGKHRLSSRERERVMAPKRKAKMVKTTRKLVQQTVQVAVVDGGNKLVAELEQEAETSSKKITQEEEREGQVLKTTITVEAGGKSSSSLSESGQVTINVPTHQPQKTAVAAETPVTPSPRPERRRKIAIENKEREEEKGREERMEEERLKEKTEENKEEESPKGIKVSGEREESEEETRPTKSPEEEGVKVDQEPDKTEQEVGGNEETKAEDGTEKKRQGGRKGEGRGRRRKRSAGVGEEQYKRYVFRVLKQVHPGLAITSAAMEILNAYMNDMFERLAEEAAKLKSYTGIKTLSAREIQGAVRLVLPGELGKHAIAEGAKAVANYMAYENGGGGSGSGSGGGGD